MPGSVRRGGPAPTLDAAGHQPACRHLLPLLRDTGHARTMQLADWDETLRLARAARLLGTLAERLRADAATWVQVPPPVRGHLQAATHFACHRAQLMRMELRALAAALPADVPVVLLKGAAYLAAGLPLARGRLPGDVDLLVRRADLDRAEAALLRAGWASATQDAYDQRYYREWSHELPPMRMPGHALEVDLHHTIAPVTGRCRADDALLLAASLPLADSRYLVLHPADQLIHAAIHLFQDTELDGRLRDLVDLDGLLRRLPRADAGARLRERAARHGASRMLWYALHYCRGWLGTPVAAEAWPAPPPVAAQRWVDWIMRRHCLPRLPDRAPSAAERAAARAAQLRYHLLRMPPALLLRHVAHKAWQAMPHRSAGAAAAQSRG